MRSTLVVLTAVLCGCGAKSSAGLSRLSDRAAAVLLEEAWRSADLRLPLGEVRVVRSERILTRRQVVQSDMAWYDALKDEGVIALSQRTDLTSNRSFSWGNFFELSQQGVLEKIVVDRTTPGATRYKCTPERMKSLALGDALCVSQGVGKIDEIVSGEQVLVGTRTYHFFMGNHRMKWSPVALKAMAALKEDTSENRKFMAVAAYDPFLKKWTLDDVDIAPRAGTFARQQQFGQFLSPLGQPRLASPSGR